MTHTSETVYMASGNFRNRQSKYHTDPDCSRLKLTERIVEVERASVEDRYAVCSFCENDVPTAQSSAGHYRSLIEAAQEASD